MASIVQNINKTSMSINNSINSKDKKLSKTTLTSTLNFGNELKMNKNIKSLRLNISTKSLNNNKSSLIHSASTNPQSINNLFKLTSPTTPTFNNYPTTKQNSIIYIHTKEDLSDSESDESLSSSISPRSSNKNNLNLNINSILKDIKSLNFKYRSKGFFDSNITLQQSQENLNILEQSLIDNKVIKNIQNNNNDTTDTNNNDNKMESSTETLLVVPSFKPVDSSLNEMTEEFKNLILTSPTPPPTSELPPPPKPTPKFLPPPPPLFKTEINLDSFEINKTIGTGSFGRVHLVKSKTNGKFYAMKAIPKARIAKEQQIEHILEEKRILSELNHPLFIKLLGTFQTRTHLFIVTNYIAGGELFAVLKKKNRFLSNVAKFYAAEVTIALEYLHSKNIIYRDLKPENIMLDITGHIKLVDLGFAKYVPDVTYTLCGTPEYMAPEVILSKAYGKAVDWYSLGILIFEMLCGYPPYHDQDQLLLYKKILTGKIHWPSYINEDAKDLIQNLITPDITKRYGNLKNGAEDIKQHKWFENVSWSKVSRLGITPPFIPEIYNEGDTRHFQRYSESCDKEYYITQDQEASLNDDVDDYAKYFEDF